MKICKECRKITTQKYYQENKESKKLSSSEYYKNNKEKANKCRLAYQRKKVKEDIRYRLTRNLRNRLYHALRTKNWKKNTNFTKYIGCTREELIVHLELKFTPDMNWSNYGDWHIDHIIPLDSAGTEEQLYQLCHYTNLQPMWALENIVKSNKHEYIFNQIYNFKCKDQ